MQVISADKDARWISSLISRFLVDNMGHTAGDIALSFNDEKTYTLIRDTGIRSGLSFYCIFRWTAAYFGPELLLSLLNTKSAEVSSLVLRATDTSAAASADQFLSSKLRFVKDNRGQDICMLRLDNGEEVGVMMGWEREIMRETVHSLCGDHPNRSDGLTVLNVGFGLGIVRLTCLLPPVASKLPRCRLIPCSRLWYNRYPDMS
jgi:type IV protein arginine methyltransferase